MQTLGCKPDLSIVIPCFNEGKNIELVLERFAQIRSELNYSAELIFVDGGSQDGTPEFLVETIERLQLLEVKVEAMPSRGGYGADIMHGLSSAQGAIVAWTHADMQTDLKDVFDAYELYRLSGKKNLFVKGVRKKRPFFDQLFTFGMQVFTLLTLRVNLHDINAQPKLFPKEFADQLASSGPPRDFSLDLYAMFLAQKLGYGLATLPVVFSDRVHGEAKGGGGGLMNKINLMKRTVRYILALRGRI